jgi:hypothetical protein
MRKLIYCPAIVKAHFLFAPKGKFIEFKMLSRKGLLPGAYAHFSLTHKAPLSILAAYKISTCGNYDQREWSPLHLFGKFNLNMSIQVPQAIFVSALTKMI